MADVYEFTLSHNGLAIIVNDPIVAPNDWESRPRNNCLIVESGNIVDDSSGNFTLGTSISGGQVVLRLLGAGWNSEVGDSGDAEVLLGTCTPKQTWELTRKE